MKFLLMLVFILLLVCGSIFGAVVVDTNIIKTHIENGTNIFGFIFKNLLGLVALVWTAYQEIRSRLGKM